MKDSLIGIITVGVLGVAVWITQDKVYNYNPKQPIAQITQANEVNNIIEDEYTKKKIPSCDSCSEDIGLDNNFSFSEAFSLCRNCLGDNGLFSWNGKRYSTKLHKENKIKEINLVEKEPANSTSPPNDETVDSE